MIFKTFDNGLTGLINKIGVFNKSFNTIGRDLSSGQGLFTSLFSGNNITQKDIQAITAFDAAMKNGSTTAQAWQAHMTGCTVAAKQQAKQCLLNKGSLSELTTGIQSTTLSAKAGKVALQGLATAGNMITMLAITKGIELAVKGIDNLVNSAEHCKKRVDDLMSSYKSALDNANSNAKTVEGLAYRYEELSKGVNNLGQNISLTADEYSEYNNITNQIADMFPTLVQGWTEEGNAILSVKGNVEQLRDAYKDAQQEAYNMLITSGKDSDGNDIIKNWNNLDDTTFFDFGDIDVGKGISYNEAIKTLNAVQQMSYDDYLEARASRPGRSFSKLSKEQKTVFSHWKYLDDNLGRDFHSEEEYAEYQKKAKVLLQTYNAEVESRLSDVETLANAYLMTNDDYEKLDEQSKNVASIMVNNLSADIASGFKTKEDVGEYVDDIVQIIRSNPEAKQAMINLFTMDTTNMPVGKIQEKVDSYIGTISDVMDGETPVELKTRLGFDDSTTQPLINKVQGFLQDEFDDKVGELTLEELKIATEQIEVPEGHFLSWDELIAKIKEVQSLTPDGTPTISFTEAFNAKEFASAKEKLLDLATSGELSADTISSTEEYKKLMDQTGLSAEQLVENPLDISGKEC